MAHSHDTSQIRSERLPDGCGTLYNEWIIGKDMERYVAEKVVLAYSGGLDTSVAVRWLREEYGYDVVTLTMDLGQGVDLSPIQKKALKVGASQAFVVDARPAFVNYFIWPALQAGALYQGVYPLATALGR